MSNEPPPLPVGGPGPTQDERTLAMLCHIGGFLTWILVPLIVWQMKKAESRFLDDQGKEALNFQIALGIGYVVGCLTVVLWIPLLIYEIVVVIQAAIATHRGEAYRYPFTLRLIK